MSAGLWLCVVVFNQQVWSMLHDGERLKDEGGSAELSGHGAVGDEKQFRSYKGLKCDLQRLQYANVKTSSSFQMEEGD